VDDLVAGAAEEEAQCRGDVRVILDDEQPTHAITLSILPAFICFRTIY
jgi:hypothetical protein